MRLIDPDVELVAAGSSGPDMPTFGEWERTVLAECLPDVDHLSLHLYVEDADGTDPASLLASGDGSRECASQSALRSGAVAPPTRVLGR